MWTTHNSHLYERVYQVQEMGSGEYFKNCWRGYDKESAGRLRCNSPDLTLQTASDLIAID